MFRVMELNSKICVKTMISNDCIKIIRMFVNVKTCEAVCSFCQNCRINKTETFSNLNFYFEAIEYEAYYIE